MQLNGLDYTTLLTELNAAGWTSFFGSSNAPLSGDEPNNNTIYLRHDIDDNIEAALEMAKIEAEMKVVSTYFMLDTVPYFYCSKSEMRQIEELGHEIGWHNNAIVAWLKSNNTKLDLHIELPLKYLRSLGLNIRGTASHGDPMCREMGFVNYQVWDCFGKKNDLDYTQRKLSDFGLEYEAYQFNKGWYLSDSGGRWNVEDPLEYIRTWRKHGAQPLQVLVHSQWWK